MASARNQSKKLITFLTLTLAAILLSGLSYSATSRPLFSNTISVWVFDIGQGDAILIDTGKEQVLIDGGPSSAILQKLEATIPLWDRTIEYAINTHPHADHVNGLVHTADSYYIEQTFSDGQPYYSDSYYAFGALSEPLRAGTTIELAHDVTLEVLWPREAPLETLEDPNDSSVTILLTAHGHTMLLTGDIGVEQEKEIATQIGDIDILKVGHHGSKTSSGESFLEIIKPEYALISLATDNKYGHPNPGTINRLERAGAEIYQTNLHGDIRVQFSPSNYSIDLFDL